MWVRNFNLCFDYW